MSYPTPFEPQAAPRRRPRRWVLPVAAVVVALGAGGVFVARGVSAPSGPSVVAHGTVSIPDLPWPAEGQAAAEVEGLGSLGSSGAQTPAPIASVTKVMTAYVVLHDHPLSGNDEGPSIEVDAQAQDEAEQAGSTGESTVRVVAGQRLSERQLLAAMLIPSGNNIARLLARWDAGSQEAFVREMNDMAASLGMRQTTYTGASGVEDSTVSTATDQLILGRAAMGNEVIASIVNVRRMRIPGIPGDITNTNTLLGRDGVVGIKTGSTSAAGGALMWAAYANGAKGPRLVIGVVLYQQPGGSPDAGLAAALDASQKLVAGIDSALPTMA